MDEKKVLECNGFVFFFWLLVPVYGLTLDLKSRVCDVRV